MSTVKMSGITDKPSPAMGACMDKEETMSTAIAAKLDLESIMQRITNGEYASHIARELGISPQILSYHLRKNPEWQQALETAHEVRLDSTDKQIEEAIQQRDFELARACEGLLKRREWRAERECPQRWGQKQEITHHNHSVDIKSLLDQREQRIRTIDGEAQVVEGG